MNTKNDIFDIEGMGIAARSMQYNDLSSALSEIVDNSIEYDAKNIYIILKDNNYQDNLGSIRAKLGEIAVVDDGIGIDELGLSDALSIGKSSSTKDSKISKFGVGMKFASLFLAPRLNLFSWKEHIDNAYWSYLDTNEWQLGVQNTIPNPIKKCMPEYVCTALKQSFKLDTDNRLETGSCVLLENVDKVNDRASVVLSSLDIELGKRYRKFIDKGLNIYLLNSADSEPLRVELIDPLFNMEKSRYRYLLTEYSIEENNLNGEIPFEPFIINKENGSNELKIEILLPNNKYILEKHYVTVRTTIVKDKLYRTIHERGKNPGDTSLGKKLGKYNKISVLRQGREIAFDKFNFFSVENNPTQRWWALEIEFDNDLDDFFVISSNKQNVTIPKKLDVEKGSGDNCEAWKKIYLACVNAIKDMNKRNKSIVEEARNKTHKSTDSEDKEVEKNVVEAAIINLIKKQDEVNAEKENGNYISDKGNNTSVYMADEKNASYLNEVENNYVQDEVVAVKNGAEKKRSILGEYCEYVKCVNDEDYAVKITEKGPFHYYVNINFDYNFGLDVLSLINIIADKLNYLSSNETFKVLSEIIEELNIKKEEEENAKFK
ncbi:MAG: ATP-binding protein [Erysipelotrichaceae bacterium]